MNFLKNERLHCAGRLCCLRRGGAILLGAFLLLWPAFFNGFPLLYPDSMTYIGDGRVVARAVFLHQLSDYYGVRSFFYSLGILPFHWNLTVWPVAALQCLLVAWVLWLVARSVAPKRIVGRYLALMLFLSLLTSVSWYADFVMPDILGPLVYLSLYLIVFVGESLSRAERWSLFVIAGWGITAHSSHLLLAGGLWVLLALIAAWERTSFRRRLRGLCQAAAVLAVAVAAQMALHGYLYGKPSVNGTRPPYLMSRIIADGPGRVYLENNCPHLHWIVCKHLSQLSDNPDDFLWSEDGAYQGSSDVEQRQMDAEEMPLVLATVRAYPAEQLARSAANFREQLMSFGNYGFDANDWLLGQFDEVLPGAQMSYLKSKQAQNALPLDFISSVQFWTLMASMAALMALIPLLWRRHSEQLLSLGLTIFATVIANALVTGVLSVVDDRYQCRVIWMIPLLAGLCLLDWLAQREGRGIGVRG